MKEITGHTVLTGLLGNPVVHSISPMMHNEGLVVSDVIYNPRETKLLKMAKEAGCETFNGLYMLLYQGAEAF